MNRRTTDLISISNSVSQKSIHTVSINSSDTTSDPNHVSCEGRGTMLLDSLIFYVNDAAGFPRKHML